jgi:carboxylate-amine ligase
VLVRFLFGHPEHNAELDSVDRAIAVENKWRAQRHGAQGTFVTRSGAVGVSELVDRIVELTGADAEALSCTEEMQQCRAILVEGTSADAQLRVFAENQCDDTEIALRGVTRWIRDATLVA